MQCFHIISVVPLWLLGMNVHIIDLIERHWPAKLQSQCLSRQACRSSRLKQAILPRGQASDPCHQCTRGAVVLGITEPGAADDLSCGAACCRCSNRPRQAPLCPTCHRGCSSRRPRMPAGRAPRALGTCSGIALSRRLPQRSAQRSCMQVHVSGRNYLAELSAPAGPVLFCMGSVQQEGASRTAAC